MDNMDYMVLVKVDDQNRITDINSTAFVIDLTGWTKVESMRGYRYKYAIAALRLPLIRQDGVLLHKLEDGKIMECTAEEIAQQEEAMKPVPFPTLEDRVETLETTTDDMILLMADLIGGE